MDEPSQDAARPRLASRPRHARGDSLRAPRWAGVLSGALVLLSLSSPSQAFDLRIGARTEMSARVESKGTRVALDGYLRDNLGQGLEGEIIQIEFEPVDEAEEAYYSRDARTDRTGRFYLSLALDPGQYRAVLTYTGREHYYERSSLVDTVTSERGAVTLSLQAPPLLDRRAGAVSIRVAATHGPAPVPNLRLTMEVDGDAADVVTGPDGIATVPFDPERADRILVPMRLSFEGSKAFEAAEVTSSVRLLDDPSLSLSARNVRARLERGVSVEGEVVDRRAGVSGALVDLVLVQGGLEVARYSTRTQDDGGYQLFVPEDRLKEGRLEVRARLSVAGRALREETTTLKVTRTGGGLLPWLLAILLGGSVLVMLFVTARDWWRSWQRRRPRRSHKSRRALTEARAPGLMPITPVEGARQVPDGPQTIAGVLWDRQLSAPIAGGHVSLFHGGPRDAALEDLEAAAAPVVADERGRFNFADLPPGAYVLSARAKGYVSARASFKVPHGGALSHFRFPLTPVRVVVRDLYEEMVEEVVRESGSWGRLTPRQLRTRLLLAVEDAIEPDGRFPGGGEGFAAFKARLEQALKASRGDAEIGPVEVVEAVVTVLEEVYYSQRLHDEALVEVMERLVVQVRHHAQEG